MSNEATPRAKTGLKAFNSARSSTLSSSTASTTQSVNSNKPVLSTGRKKSVNIASARPSQKTSTLSSMAAMKKQSSIRAPTSTQNRSGGISSIPLPSSPTKNYATMPMGGERTPTKHSAISGSATVGSKRNIKSPVIGTIDNEPLKAYLRVRPASEEHGQNTSTANVEPYIEVVNDTEVCMNPPKDSSAPRARAYANAVPTKYTFSRVFAGDAPDTSQATFFQHTTLPLVDELLQGQSGLIFTYGVTNSGKSYTVQGGDKEGEAGILPRSLDVIFNSIKDVESTSDIRPVGLSGVERISDDEHKSVQQGGINPFSLPGMSKRLAADGLSTSTQYDHDTETKIRVDRNYRYSVWASYVEVYNEKIFDLLDAAPPSSSSASTTLPRSSSMFGGFTRSESMRGSNWTLANIANGGNNNDGNGPIYLQRKPLSLKNDIEAGGKYVAGLQEIRIHSSAEARELMRRGQENRRVFATMANRASSRSHGVFTIKIIREHAGEDDLTLACSTSRLSIVDLAGSERLSNTSATGDRLKEAGSINKSLMCLGQCIETLRKNQARAASFVPAPMSPISSSSGFSNSVIPRVLKRRPSIVPFRHSKLTELFQSFFTGEGRAVMIVNVNPFDTGFDENSHVMRFSAAAKEIHTVRTQGQASNLTRFVHPSLRNLFNGQNTPSKQSNRESNSTVPPSPTIYQASQATPRANAKALPGQRAAPSSVSEIKQSMPPSHADRSVQVAHDQSREVTIIEASDEEDEDDEGDKTDPFVDHLMQKYEEMRQALFESEMRCAMIEREVREEMAEEMSIQLEEMQRIYNERLLSDAAHNEKFVNRKLDLLARASGFSHQDSGDMSSQISASFASMEEEELEEGEEEDDDDEEYEDLEVEQALEMDPSVSNESTAVDEEDGSVIVLPSKSKSRRLILSEDEEEEGSEDEEEVDEEEQEEEEMSVVSNIEHDSQLQGESDYSSISMDLPPRMLKPSKARAIKDEEDEDEDKVDISQGTTQDESVIIDQSASTEEEEESEEEEEEDSSDGSFNLGEESVESSFEAAPRARTSRARQSTISHAKQTKGRATTAIGTSRAAKANTSRAPPVRRRTTAAATTIKASGRKSVLPLGDSSAANISLEHQSDASLVLTKNEVKKSPKKRLLGRKTLVDEDTILQHIADSSLIDELQRRVS